jgi:formamidopyrimidine-DNA glycosylase
MPELPEVQTVVSGLSQTIVGKTIENYRYSGKSFRGKKALIDPQTLIASTIKKCLRRAKYILLELSNNYTLLIHLGMSGKLLFQSSDLKHDHLVLVFKDNTTLRFNDPRRFGILKVIKTNDLDNEPLLKNLGVEPLEPEFTTYTLGEICKNKNSPIKSVLMNANQIVGIGNIYASEALFDARILPNRKASTLSSKEISSLYISIVKVLTIAIQSGGSTLRDYVRSNGDVGYFQHQFKVYGRHDKPCTHCGFHIQKTIMSGRSTYSCNKCQS